MPGTNADIDVATMVWNVGWVQRAIETDASLLYSDSVLIPFGADLRAHTYGILFPALLVYPIARAFDVLVAFNVMLLVTLVLNGWFGYALFRQIGAGRAASIGGGVRVDVERAESRSDPRRPSDLRSDLDHLRRDHRGVARAGASRRSRGRSSLHSH